MSCFRSRCPMPVRGRALRVDILTRSFRHHSLHPLSQRRQVLYSMSTATETPGTLQYIHCHRDARYFTVYPLPLRPQMLYSISTATETQDTLQHIHCHRDPRHFISIFIQRFQFWKTHSSGNCITKIHETF